MLLKGTAELVHDQIPSFYSWLFLVEKATGGWRPVIYLLSLSKFVLLMKFMREMVVPILASVRKGDFMISRDLKDAYFQISIHPKSCPFLHFVMDGMVYQFKVLCFGLSTVPQVFALVSKWVHQRGIWLLRCLNDWLTIAESLFLLL